MLVLSPEWTIVAANQERLRVTETTLAGQIGRHLFEIFIDDVAARWNLTIALEKLSGWDVSPNASLKQQAGS